MTNADDTPLKRTPLYDLHKSRGARMVPFAGYEMPLQYKGIMAEHKHARSSAVLFDVSHMGQATVPVEYAQELEGLVVADVVGLPTGKMRYTLLTNERGGIIDDLMIIHGGYYIWLIYNAARKDVDLEHIRKHMPADMPLTTLDDRALLALQGPQASKVLARLAPASKLMLFMTSEDIHVGDIKCSVCRSGYTGEDGFEIAVDAEHATELAKLILQEPEVMPAGLGARDTLRLEAGFCLYGNDIDETTTPIEAGLAWTINRRRREEGGFLGDEIILRQLMEGPARKRVGILLRERLPARAGAAIESEAGQTIGHITSGSFSPTLEQPIAMGYVAAEHAGAGTVVNLLVRGKRLAGEIVKLPFVQHGYAKS